MHELSIAKAIVDVAVRHARGRQVYRVEVRVGHLRQVVSSALQFGFQLLADGTVLQGAELAIEEVPVQALCRSCGAETTLTQFPLQCSSCGGLDLEILAGEELLVEALECEETLATEGITHGG